MDKAIARYGNNPRCDGEVFLDSVSKLHREENCNVTCCMIKPYIKASNHGLTWDNMYWGLVNNLGGTLSTYELWTPASTWAIQCLHQSYISNTTMCIRGDIQFHINKYLNSIYT